MDCLGVAQVVNGEAVLRAPHLEAIFRRICRRLGCIWESGWKPRRDIDPFVIWSARKFNSAADYMVNLAMDAGRDFEIDLGRLRQQSLRHIRLKVCIDGGLRRCGSAALGIVVYGADGPEAVEIGRAARKLTGIGSAFQSEATALEWIVDMFCNHIL